MSFYDDLNNFVHNYPYTNYHELVLDFLTKLVQDLEKIVDEADLESLPEKFAAINDTLNEHQQEILALQGASASASEAILSLREITAQHTLDLAAIHEEIDGVIDQLSDAVEALEGELNELNTDYQLFKGSTNAAIEALNEAAFDPSQIVMNTAPFNFAMSTLNGNSNGMRIVVDSGSSGTDSIRWVDEGSYTQNQQPPNNVLNTVFKMPQFETYGNPCHLIIPNVLPYKYNGKADSHINYTLYFYANRYFDRNHGDNVWVRKVGGISLNALLQTGGVQQEVINDDKVCFIDMEMHVNQETGAYDLYLYNGRNSTYQTIGSYKPSSFIISTIDLGDVTNWAGAQRYFNLLNSYAPNVYSLIDSKTSTAIAEAVAPIQSAITQMGLSLNGKMDLSSFASESFTPVTGVTVRSNNSFSDYHNYSYDGHTFRAQMWFIDLSVEITALPDDENFTIGSFDIASRNFDSAKTLNTDILHANNGSYSAISTTGSITVHPYGNFGSGTTQLRITGAFIDKKQLS